jgi:hypothetical protein
VKRPVGSRETPSTRVLVRTVTVEHRAIIRDRASIIPVLSTWYAIGSRGFAGSAFAAKIIAARADMPRA